MTVTNIQMEFTGQVGANPRLGRMITTDVIATITTAGYLNNQPNVQNVNFLPTDMIAISYNNGAGGSATALFALSISAGVITLITPALNTAQVSSVTTVSTTPASGSCAAQFQFKNGNGANTAVISPVSMYISDTNGNLSTAASSIVALTNGVLHQLVTGQFVAGTTNASGQVGITLTASAGTYYVSFVLPNGHIVVSSALVCN